ncbi:MAG TPA: hypothetical protein VHN39_18615, partial [Phenylobacterium sp.]|nr:hypothetical protein [Phenylobacterium sp.]
VDSKVTSSLVTNDPFGVATNINGEAFPNSPKSHLTGDVQYTAALVEGWRWFAGAGAQYRSATTAAFAGGPLFDVRGYTLLDLRGGVESENGRWRVTAWGNNVTDQFYVTNVSHVVDAVARVTGMPATYGVTLGYRY